MKKRSKTWYSKDEEDEDENADPEGTSRRRKNGYPRPSSASRL